MKQRGIVQSDRIQIFGVLLGVLLCSESAQAQLSVTNNLILWLKADALSLSDGAAVSSWTDSSLSANHATQGTATNQPIFEANEINGLPVVRFTRDFTDGAFSDFLSTTYTTLPGGLTYVAVTRGTILGFGKGSTANASLNIIGDSTGGFWNGFGQTAGKAEFNAYDQPNSTFDSYQGTTTLNDGVARDMMATFSTSGDAGVYVNGLLEASGSTPYNASFIAFNRIARGFVSGVPPFQGDGFDGDIAEVLIYNTALTATDRQSVHEYLVAKYALPEPSVATLGLLALVALRRIRGRRA